MRNSTLLNDPWFLGFDDMFSRLDKVASIHTKQPSYPPYNEYRSKDNKYILEFALAGFNKEDITITVKEGLLTVSGHLDEATIDGYECYRRGIGKRDFTLTWSLADTVEVLDAEMNEGILSIYMENVVPEHKKERVIQIGNSQQLLTE